MKCPNCGKEVLPGAYKCVGCGKALPSGPAAAVPVKPKALCPHCRKEILAGASKCHHCGKTIKHGQAAPIAASEKQKCPSCGAEVSAGAAKCQQCGKDLAPIPAQPLDPNKCPKCGKTVPPEKAFCGSCGTKLNRAPITQPPLPEDLPEPPAITGVILGLALGTVAASVVADLAHLIAESLIAGIIIAMASIAMGGFVLFKTRLKAPPWVSILAIAGMFLSRFSLVLPRPALFLLIVFISVVGFFAFKAFLGRKLGKTTAASVAFLVGFSFMLLSGFIAEKVFGIFITTPPTDEAKFNLSQFQMLQRMYLARNRKYAITFDELGWQPANRKNYAYFLGPDLSIQPTDNNYKLPEGINSFVSEGGYQLIAVGNIDKDETLDVWSIQSDYPLEHLVNDVKN